MTKEEKELRACYHWTEWERKAKDLENKIADIKANCDLAIEGRDIKIKELEQKNKELEKRLVFARAEFQRQYKENAELKEKLALREYAD